MPATSDEKDWLRELQELYARISDVAQEIIDDDFIPANKAQAMKLLDRIILQTNKFRDLIKRLT